METQVGFKCKRSKKVEFALEINYRTYTQTYTPIFGKYFTSNRKTLMFLQDNIGYDAAGVHDVIQIGRPPGRYLFSLENAEIANIFAIVVKYDAIKHLSAFGSILYIFFNLKYAFFIQKWPDHMVFMTSYLVSKNKPTVAKLNQNVSQG